MEGMPPCSSPEPDHKLENFELPNKKQVRGGSGVSSSSYRRGGGPKRQLSGPESAETKEESRSSYEERGRGVKEFRRWFSSLIPCFVIANIVKFVVTIRENPLLGPSSLTVANVYQSKPKSIDPNPSDAVRSFPVFDYPPKSRFDFVKYKSMDLDFDDKPSDITAAGVVRAGAKFKPQPKKKQVSRSTQSKDVFSKGVNWCMEQSVLRACTNVELEGTRCDDGIEMVVEVKPVDGEGHESAREEESVIYGRNEVDKGKFFGLKDSARKKSKAKDDQDVIIECKNNKLTFSEKTGQNSSPQLSAQVRTVVSPMENPEDENAEDPPRDDDGALVESDNDEEDPASVEVIKWGRYIKQLEKLDCDAFLGFMVEKEPVNEKLKENLKKRKHQNDQFDMQSEEMLKLRASLEGKLRSNDVFSSTVLKFDKAHKRQKVANRKLETFDDYVDDADNNTDHVTADKLTKLVSTKRKPKTVSGDDDLSQRDDIGERRRKFELRVLTGAGVEVSAEKEHLGRIQDHKGEFEDTNFIIKEENIGD